MKLYSEIRDELRTGDVLLCKKRSLVSILIRIFTAESFNHVAMIHVNGMGRVDVAEMQEGKGFQMTPMSQWMLRTTAEVYLGRSPDIDRVKAATEIQRTRSLRPNYSYWTLATVWLSQVFNRRAPAGRVCSTWAAAVWEKAGYDEFKRTPDPGDFVRHVKKIEAIRYA